MEIKFRTLNANEIECRVGQCKETGCSLLLYQDSRCGMNLLDEVVGPMNWSREHNFKEGKLYCRVGIWDDKKNQFVYKEDVGVESNTEQEKGQASDSFKRACVNWGIGRELYSAPFIWIKLDQKEVVTGNGKPRLVPSLSFEVSDIGYDLNKNIIKLVIKDNTGKERFTYGKKAKVNKAKEEVVNATTDDFMVPTPEDIADILPSSLPETLTTDELRFVSKDEILTDIMIQSLQGIKYKNAPIELKKAITDTIRNNMEIRGLKI